MADPNKIETPEGLLEPVAESLDKFVEKETVDFMAVIDPYVRIEAQRLCSEAGFVPNRFFSPEISTGLKPVGNMVILKIAKTQDICTAGGLIVPMNIAKNYRMVRGEIIAVGPAAYHLRPGMIVEFDQHATFNYGDAGCDTPDEIVATRSDNIILCHSAPAGIPQQ